MKASRPALAALAAAVVVLQGCPSAYQRTYEQETQRLKNERSSCQLNFTIRRAASTIAK